MTALVEDITPRPRAAAAPQGIGSLVLARLSVAFGATRAEIVRDLMPLVSHRLSPAEWRAAAAEAAAELLSSGLAAEARGRLTPTDAGAEAMRGAFGHRGAVPASWPDLRDQRLVARALGLEGESAAKLKSLATPDGLRAIILQKAFGLPLKGNQTANRLRVELAVVALERAFGNKIKGGLGASGGFTAKAGRLLAGQLSARPRDFGSDGRLIAELAAEQAGAPQSDADAVRLALLRRWVSTLLPSNAATPTSPAAPVTATAALHRAERAGHVRDAAASSAPTPANDAGPAVPTPQQMQRPGLEDFAAAVKTVAGTVAEGWPGNRKAFISQVWQAIRASWPRVAALRDRVQVHAGRGPSRRADRARQRRPQGQEIDRRDRGLRHRLQEHRLALRPRRGVAGRPQNDCG